MIDQLKSFQARLVKCHRLEHGGVIPDEEIAALDKAVEILEGQQPSVDSGVGEVVEETSIA